MSAKKRNRGQILRLGSAGQDEKEGEPEAKHWVGPVPFELAQQVTGLANPSYFQVLLKTSEVTHATVDYLDGLPGDDI